MNKNDLNITISSDKLSAYLDIDAKAANYPTEQELLDYLKAAGIKFGIDRSLVKKICDRKETVQNQKIARGQKPVKGEDGQLVWHLGEDIGDDKVSIDEAGLANFKQAKTFCEVKQGEQIVSKLPARSGTPGKTVTGEILPSGEKHVDLPEGENVSISDDGLTLYATKSGYLNFQDGKVDISNMLHIEGDVSYNTGNVKYDGKVVIEGDVRSGFRVEATDSVIINGDVEAADIRSKKGDVIIKMGVLGKGRAKIVAGNNIECGFIQDAEAKANNDVIAERYIINGNVYAAGMVIVEENEGLIRGGKIFGEKGISVKEAGSMKNISTQLGIGLNRNPERENALTQLVKEEDELYAKYELLSKKERFLKLLFERVDKLSEDKKQELQNITAELKQIQQKLSEIEKQKKAIASESHDIDKKNKIIITEKLHKGVLLLVGSEEFYIDKLYEKVIIYQDLDSIVIDDLKIEQE